MDQKWKEIIQRKAKAAADAITQELRDAIRAFEKAPSRQTAIDLRRIAREFRKLDLFTEKGLQAVLSATDEYI